MNEISFSDRLKALKPFRVMEIAEQARLLESQGRSIVHFEIGELDFPTAAPIVDRAKVALENELTKYTGGNGLYELREKISGQYFEMGIDIDPEQILITNGASGGLLLLLAGLLDAGDHFLSSDPGYPCHGAFASVIGTLIENVTLKISAEFQPEPTEFESRWSDSVKGILLSSPANPTGVIVQESTLKELKELADRKKGFLIVDEIYQGINLSNSIYESALVVDGEIFILNSFSKYFGMTGWRLGWLIVPDQAVDSLIRIAQNLFICPSVVAQAAAVAAFHEEAIEEADRRSIDLAQKRRLMSEGLKALGFRIPANPDGAFYLFAEVPEGAPDAETFCEQALQQVGVAMTPGIDFGDNDTKRFVRISCAQPTSALLDALQRLRGLDP